MLYDDLLQIVITLEIYGVKNIVGIPFGYRGFCSKDLTGMPVCSFYIVLVFVKKSIDVFI